MTNSANGDDYPRALTFTAGRHAGQERKHTTVPHASHVLTLSALVREDGSNKTEAIGRAGPMSNQRPDRCPSCGATDAIPIEYGLPGPEMWEAIERGEIALGGCLVDPGQPSRHCVSCDTEF